MHVTKRVSLVVLLFALNIGLVWGQAPAKKLREPDVIFVPTPQEVVDTLTRYRDSLPVPHLDLSRYISTGSNRKPFYGAFQPRLGFSLALDNNNKTTLFGGWGIYYSHYSGNIPGDLQKGPFAATSSSWVPSSTMRPPLMMAMLRHRVSASSR